MNFGPKMIYACMPYHRVNGNVQDRTEIGVRQNFRHSLATAEMLGIKDRMKYTENVRCK